MVTLRLHLSVQILFVVLICGIRKGRIKADQILDHPLPLNEGESTLLGDETELGDLDMDCIPDEHNGVTYADGQAGTCRRQKRHAGHGTGTLVTTPTPLQNTSKSAARLLFDDFKPADPTDFIELQGDTDTYHQLLPNGYALYPRTKMLPFLTNDPTYSYPPFSYHGLYGPSSWHQIPWEDFLRLKNRSFMLLKHKCETQPSASTGGGSGSSGGSASPGSGTSGTPDADLTEMVSCQHEEFPKLPNCDSNFQSPINIVRSNARHSDLLSDYTYRNFDQKLQLLMSLPWDGTSLLTVEFLNAGKNPKDSLSHYSSSKQFNTPTANPAGSASNSGSSVLGKGPQISLGALLGPELYLDRIHIKYGTKVSEGSEHQLDGKSFAMELQFIFTKEGRQFMKQYWDELMAYYTSEGEGGESPESLYGKQVHIISVFVEVVDKIDSKDKWAVKAAEEFKKLSAAAKHFWTVHNRPEKDTRVPAEYQGDGFRARGFKSTTDASSITLSHLIPPKEVVDGKVRSSPYYTYQGSLTHPPCFEYVNFGVYEKPIQITRDMWTAFYFIPNEFDDTRFLAGNFRPVSLIYNFATDLKIQKDREKVEAAANLINSRPVRKSNPKFDDESSSDLYDFFEVERGSVKPSSKLLLLIMSVIYFVLIL